MVRVIEAYFAFMEVPVANRLTDCKTCAHVSRFTDLEALRIFLEALLTIMDAA